MLSLTVRARSSVVPTSLCFVGIVEVRTCLYHGFILVSFSLLSAACVGGNFFGESRSRQSADCCSTIRDSPAHK